MWQLPGGFGFKIIKRYSVYNDLILVIIILDNYFKFNHMQSENTPRTGKRWFAGTIAASLVIGSFAFIAPAKAASEPEIDKVEDRGRKSVTLRVEDDRFVNEKAVVKVTVWNKRTGAKVKTKHFTERMNEDGKATVRVGGLTPNTEYRFVVRVKDVGDDSYRGSDSKTIRTKSL